MDKIPKKEQTNLEKTNEFRNKKLRKTKIGTELGLIMGQKISAKKWVK